MIGIIGAMDVEVDGIKAVIEDKKTKKISGVEFVSGYIFGKEVVVAKCGIGKVFAALCTEAMITEFSPECIINTGVAGALSPKLSTTDIAVSAAVVQHDMDTSVLGDPVGLISGINMIEIPADASLAGRLVSTIEKLGLNCEKGVIASGDCFVADSVRKKFITETFGAIACEMEGAAVGHVCYVNGVPFAILRAISDTADGSSAMDYSEFLPRAAQNSISIVTRFLEEY